ncbi:MAG: hypothetical protein R3B96_09065 [Pirellulaceae bacterium]
MTTGAKITTVLLVGNLLSVSSTCFQYRPLAASLICYGREFSLPVSLERWKWLVEAGDGLRDRRLPACRLGASYDAASPP